MRRVIRHPLDAAVEDDLNRRQGEADQKQIAGTLHPANEWKSARQSQPLLSVLAQLKSMMGERERCMYCLDSHGSDIEHFWPKTPYPGKMFRWPNLLLCCTECGRFKGEKFPLDNEEPLLIDPTDEDPWLHLDFDPSTGNIVARYDLQTSDWSLKGQKTVEILQLDRREALAVGYRRTFSRLSNAIEQWQANNGAPDALIVSLRAADDHGLLGWCFLGTGQTVSPFRELQNQHNEAWAACVAAIQNA